MIREFGRKESDAFPAYGLVGSFWRNAGNSEDAEYTKLLTVRKLSQSLQGVSLLCEDVVIGVVTLFPDSGLPRGFVSNAVYLFLHGLFGLSGLVF